MTDDFARSGHRLARIRAKWLRPPTAISTSTNSIGPVADLLQRQRGFATRRSACSMRSTAADVVLVLVGGLLVDRFGAAAWPSVPQPCSGRFDADRLRPDFASMAAGRLLFGIGAETLNIALTVAIVDYFAGGNLAFAMGLSLASAARARSPRTCRVMVRRCLCPGLAAADGHRDAACRGVARRDLWLLVDRPAGGMPRWKPGSGIEPALCSSRPAWLRDRLLVPARAGACSGTR